MSVITTSRSRCPNASLLPEDIKVSFEFDQSPYVTRAVSSVVMEGVLGAVLVGLMMLSFCATGGALVVVLNIPLA